MKRPKYSLIYAKDLSAPPGGSTGNNALVEFTSLWAGIKYVAQTKAARAAIRADRYCWIRIVPKASRPKTQADKGSSS
jgi:hypothetical protein